MSITKCFIWSAEFGQEQLQFLWHLHIT